MKKTINTLYFSPTGTTEKIVKGIAQKISENLGANIPVSHHDFTLPQARKNSLSFGSDDLVVAGVPVYAGRVPNVLLKFLDTIRGNGADAVAVVLYGNRDFDDALIELKDILEAKGFHVVGAGAFIGEHSFSTVLGANRPDEKDMAAAGDFAAKLCDRIKTPGVNAALTVKGNKPYREYYRVKDASGKNTGFLKAKPKTNSDCIDCKLCSQVCPMGSIEEDDVSNVSGICIKCCACLKNCPVGAKYFDDENYLGHKSELELKYSDVRREPEYFV